MLPITGRQFHQWLILIAAAIFFAAFPVLLHGTAFYNIDDAQSQFLPAFHEIGRQLANGQMPLISLRSWFGGNLLGEYQYAIFNPFSDLLYWLFYKSTLNIDQQAAIFASLHLILLASGCFAASKALGCRFDEALYVSLLPGTSIWVIYWASMSWLPLLVGLSWCAWAIAGLIRLQQNRHWFLGSATLIGLTWSAGLPQVDLMLGVFALAMMAVLHWRQKYRDLAFTCAALGCGLAFALPSLLPLFEAFAASTRPISYAMGTYTLPIQAVFGFGLPIFITAWPDWRGVWYPVSLPQAYLDWAFPLFFVLACRNQRLLRRDLNFTTLCIAAIILLIIAILPIAQFKYPMRFIPGVFLMLSMAIARFLVLRRETQGPQIGWTWKLFISAIACPIIVALLIAPNLPDGITPILLTVAILSSFMALILYLPATLKQYWLIALISLHGCVFCAITGFWPSNPSLMRFPLPNQPIASAQAAFSSTGNTLLLYEMSSQLKDYDQTILYGNIPLIFHGRSISGYSALGPASVNNFFHFSFIGNFFSPNHLTKLFRHDPLIGMSYADLFRIDRIVAELPPWITLATELVPADWQRSPYAATNGDGIIFSNPRQPLTADGTLSYLPTGVQAKMTSFSDRMESWEIATSNTYDGKPLVFARAWYPGYYIYLNGVVTKFELIAGLVPAVTLPPGFHGLLEIAFLPISLIWGLAIAALTALAAITFQIILLRRDRSVDLAQG